MYAKDKSLYRVSYSDPEYLENWNQKFDMICTDLQIYFGISISVGILASLLFIPSLADRYGRKGIFCLSLIVSLIA